jgi:flagellar assembly protein FliH
MSNTRNRMYTRFIPSEEVGAVSAWQFGIVGDPVLARAVEPEPEPGPPPEPEEARLQRAWDGGHAAGYAEGHADAARVGHEQLDAYVTGQGRDNAEQLAAVVQALQQRLQRCEQDMARQVLDLAAELARQVVRRELATRPDAVLPVVREALSRLVGEHKPTTVRLHPADLQVVEAALHAEFPSPTLRWAADEQVARGGCIVESAGTVVDGTLATRWQRALANLGLESAWEPTAPDAPQSEPEGEGDDN